MKEIIIAAVMLAVMAGTANAQERKVVQVIRMGDSNNYAQFDETGAIRACKVGSGKVSGVPRLICGAWVDAEPWPASTSASPSD